MFSFERIDMYALPASFRIISLDIYFQIRIYKHTNMKHHLY
jgi:hypothetical protein